MASLGMMLAGSAIGQGAANYVHGQVQGDMDRERLDMTKASDAFQQNQMNRTLGQQQIEDQTTDGATDEDRLTQLADIAGKANRGDLQRKYQGLAREARNNQQMTNIANASRAITMGQFGPATQMLNKTGLFGDIHSIGLADDVEQDERNPTYSVYTAGAPDANGNPTQGQHVHVNQQMLYQLQSKPGDALHWMAYAQNAAQKNDISQQRVDQNGTKIAETERHNRAIEAAKRAGGNGSGRLTNEQWRVQWAQTPKEQGGGGMTPQEAHMWASDPNKNSREYWKAMDLGLKVNQSGGMFTADDVQKIAAAIKGSPIAEPKAPPPPPSRDPATPTPDGAPDFKGFGFEQDPKTGNWKNPKTGVFFRHNAKTGKTEAWSNKTNGWVPAS